MNDQQREAVARAIWEDQAPHGGTWGEIVTAASEYPASWEVEAIAATRRTADAALAALTPVQPTVTQSMIDEARDRHNSEPGSTYVPPGAGEHILRLLGIEVHRG